MPPLVTGGSGLAIGPARQWAQENGNQCSRSRASARWARRSALRFMLSNDQPPGWHITVKLHQPVRLMWHAASQPKLWPLMHTSWQSGFWARKVYLLHWFLPPPALTHWQQFNSNTVHKKASQAVETLFSQLAARLAAEGVTRFIVAGGETSGVVTQSTGNKRVSYWPNHFPPACRG